jgi:hypothetical protein
MSSGRSRELAWYHEARHGGPEKASDTTADGPCADAQRVRGSRSDVRTMLAHRVSAQSSWRPHYGLQFPEEEGGHISGRVLQRTRPSRRERTYTLSRAVIHRSTMAHRRSCGLNSADMASMGFRWPYTSTTVIVARRRAFIAIAGPTTARKFSREVREAGYTASIR